MPALRVPGDRRHIWSLTCRQTVLVVGEALADAGQPLPVLRLLRLEDLLREVVERLLPYEASGEGPRAGESEGALGPRAGEYEGDLGPRAGGLDRQWLCTVAS